MYSNQQLADMHFMYSLAGGNAVVCTKKVIQDEDGQIGKHLQVSIATFVNMEIVHLVLPTWNDQDTTFLMYRRIFWMLSMKLWNQHTKGINASGCRSFDDPECCRTTAVSLPSAACHYKIVMFCQWFLQQCGTNPNCPVFAIFTDEAQYTRDGIQNFHKVGR
jgi:hypothetical protein